MCDFNIKCFKYIYNIRMGSEEIRERTKKLLNNLWEKIANT